MKKLVLFIFLNLLFCKVAFSNALTFEERRLPGLTCDRFKPNEARYTFDFKNQIMIIDKISRKNLNTINSLSNLLGYFFLPDDITEVLRFPMLGDKDTGVYAYAIQRLYKENKNYRDTYLLTFFSTNLDNIFEINSKELEYSEVFSLVGAIKFSNAVRKNKYPITITKLKSKERVSSIFKRDDDKERRIIKKLQKERFNNFFDKTAIHIKQKCHGVNW